MTIKAKSITITDISIQQQPPIFSKISFVEPEVPISVDIDLVADGIEFNIRYRPKTTIELSELMEKFKAGKHLTEITL